MSATMSYPVPASATGSTEAGDLIVANDNLMAESANRQLIGAATPQGWGENGSTGPTDSDQGIKPPGALRSLTDEPGCSSRPRSSRTARMKIVSASACAWVKVVGTRLSGLNEHLAGFWMSPSTT